MSERGFTLLELLVSIAIVVLLSGITFYQLTNFRSNRLLESDARRLTSMLEEARNLTVTGQGGSQYGVYFQSDRAVLFSGASYATATASNVVFLLSSGLSLSSISLNGGARAAVFDKLKGTTNMYGSLTLVVASATSTRKTITINKTGIIDVQ